MARAVTKRLISTRYSIRKRSSTLIFSWLVFWSMAVLAPFCSGWAAIEAAGGHAAHHSTPASADGGHGPVQGETECCHTLSDASVLDPKPEFAQSAIALGPITTIAWTVIAEVSVPGSILHATPAARSPLPVFLNTRRLRI
jgi:hypothetical protein